MNWWNWVAGIALGLDVVLAVVLWNLGTDLKEHVEKNKNDEYDRERLRESEARDRRNEHGLWLTEMYNLAETLGWKWQPPSSPTKGRWVRREPENVMAAAAPVAPREPRFRVGPSPKGKNLVRLKENMAPICDAKNQHAAEMICRALNETQP